MSFRLRHEISPTFYAFQLAGAHSEASQLRPTNLHTVDLKKGSSYIPTYIDPGAYRAVTNYVDNISAFFDQLPIPY